jgi:hypothetical protein
VTVADSEPTEAVKDPRPEVSSKIVEPSSDSSMKEIDAALAGGSVNGPNEDNGAQSGRYE